ncbi:EAL domain-containing protein [Sulfuritalea sp.]|uniref:EAL domain-containing protein n=1 Tax=Sulfuritalea sp. TaxID=2480090 RepID=UPI00286E489A|nr:EAL domain-containing protein [Sulfuritalea sp.]
MSLFNSTIAALRWLALSCCLLLPGLPSAAEPASSEPPEATLRIGILAFRGQEKALAEWQAHADFLTRKLAPHRFSIVPLTLAEFGPALIAHRIDLVITNTGHYVELEAGGRVSRIATMRIAGPQGPVDRFGGVAIARAERSDLKTYADLRGKRLAVPDVHGFGGWQVHLREAQAAGLDLGSDLAEILELQSHDKVVESVLAGRVDAGFVRSDLVESLAAADKLDLGQLRVIGARQTPNFPYWHSTQLYPHWAFAKAEHVSEELARDLLIALLSMRPEDATAVAAGIYGWTLPQNYQSVHDLFLQFRLGPYADLPVKLSDIMARYGRTIVLGAAAFVSLLLAALWAIARSNGALRRSQDRLRLAAGVFEHAQEGIMITNPKGDIVDANETFLGLTGYRRDEVLGRNPRFLSSGQQPPEFYRAMWQSLLERGVWRGEMINRRKDGTVYVQQTSISAVRDKQGRVRHYIGLSSDISALRESQDRLEQMAYFDALTGLPNRRMLSDRLQRAIAQAQRADRLLAICYLDLDDFKPINDTWGHAAGDSLLIEAAQRLMANVRAGDTVSRLGGDEFVVLLGNLAHFDECEVALERVRSALNKPFMLKEGEARVSASMGVTLFPLDGADPDTLIRHADQAMYLAKQSGRNRYTLFDAEHDRLSASRRESQRSILDAIARNQLRLYFQPKVNMRSGQVVGAEALIRWQHPERGLLDPAEFLPQVDLVRLHGPIGDWVLNNSLRLAEEWAQAGLHLVISVNVAADQLQSVDFVATLRDALARHPGVEPRNIELEILETATLKDLGKVAQVIEACSALGIGFTIDDFGTGYSSLTYLKQLQVGTLKIDQSFVQDMLDDPDDLSIVDSIVGLATAFRRRVVAEGVETVRHGELLLQLGCELAQGYGIARPMPAEDLPAWIAAWQQPTEWKNVPLWPRQDLPLLTVEVDHLRWIQLLSESIRAPAGETPPLPPLDPHNCRFGHWLDAMGHDRYGHYPGFAQLVRAHDAVHATGRRIEQLAHHDRSAACAQLASLHARRDELLLALEQLRSEVPVNRDHL